MRYRALALVASAVLVAGLAGPADAAAAVKVGAVCPASTMVDDRMSAYADGANSKNDVGVAVALSGRSSVTVTGVRVRIDVDDALYYFWATDGGGFWLGVFNLDGTPAAGANTVDGSFGVALGGKPKPYVVRGDLPDEDVSNLSGLTVQVTAAWSTGGVTGTSRASCVLP